MAKASARHILVSTENECLDLMKRIESGEIQPTDAFDALEACISARH